MITNCARVETMPTFQERFWELKGKKSLETISKAIGSNKSSLSMFISGASKIRKDMVKKLADYFDVDQAYLLGETDIPRKNDFDVTWEKLKVVIQKENYSIDVIEAALVIAKQLRELSEKKCK